MKVKKKGIVVTALCFLVCAVMTFAAVGCATTEDSPGGGDNPPAQTVSVTGVSLNKTALELLAGASEKLSATVTPADADNKRVIWSSDDRNVATITSDGTVTAVYDGTTTIRVKTADGGKEATCAVTVSSVHVTGIDIDQREMSLSEGEQGKLTVTLLPADATNKTVEWTTDHADIAVVQDGLVTGMSVGNAKITGTAVDGGLKVTCAVTVAAASVDYSKYTHISTVEQYLAMKTTGKYCLDNDLDFGGAEVPAVGFAPDSGLAQAQWFNGIFDGRGYEIKNAEFVSAGKADDGKPNNSYSGMFARIGKTGVVRNVNIIDCFTEGQCFNGIITAWNKGGLIENCYAQASVSNDNNWWDGWTLGGVLVGINQNDGDSLGRIRNCVSYSIRDGITYGLVGSNFTQNPNDKLAVQYSYVIRHASISDWVLCGNVDGEGSGGQQPLDHCEYVEIESADKAASYEYLNPYYWIIADGALPYLKNPDSTARDYKGPDIKPTISLDVTAKTVSLSGGQVQLNATVKPSNIADDKKTVTWTSNNETVATVANGVVTPKAAGTATITATNTAGRTATCVITVVGD